MGKTYKGHWLLSDNILLLKIAGKSLDLSTVQIYAPTSTSSDDHIEKFCEDLEQAKTQCRQQNSLIIMGDFNAKVREGRRERGKHSRTP